MLLAGVVLMSTYASRLKQRQVQFAQMVPELIAKAFELGYEVTLGDCYRDDRCQWMEP